VTGHIPVLAQILGQTSKIQNLQRMLVFGFTITRHLKSKKGKTFLAFLDLSKAFDSLAGRFILPIMEKWYSG
jgi:hypothetical protein